MTARARHPRVLADGACGIGLVGHEYIGSGAGRPRGRGARMLAITSGRGVASQASSAVRTTAMSQHRSSAARIALAVKL